VCRLPFKPWKCNLNTVSGEVVSGSAFPMSLIAALGTLVPNQVVTGKVNSKLEL
jgi:hypothetical protein